jgi:prepilin-type processing-associated H-X9-DG protein
MSAMQQNAVTTVTQCTDGLSNTIFVAECAARSETWHAGSGGPNTYNQSGAWSSPDIIIGPAGSLFDGTRPSGSGPCTMNCTNDLGFYSFHPTGCNFAFGDGSVRFLAASMPWATLAPLMTRNGNEVASPDG